MDWADVRPEALEFEIGRDSGLGWFVAFHPVGLPGVEVGEIPEQWVGRYMPEWLHGCQEMEGTFSSTLDEETDEWVIHELEALHFGHRPAPQFNFDRHNAESIRVAEDERIYAALDNIAATGFDPGRLADDVERLFQQRQAAGLLGSERTMSVYSIRSRLIEQGQRTQDDDDQELADALAHLVQAGRLEEAHREFYRLPEPRISIAAGGTSSAVGRPGRVTYNRAGVPTGVELEADSGPIVTAKPRPKPPSAWDRLKGEPDF